MKSLSLTNHGYQLLVAAFKEWLDILGYSKSTVYQLPNYVQEFLYYLENHQVLSITEVTQHHVQDFKNQLENRVNQTQGGGLSLNYLHKHHQGLVRFAEYVYKVHQKRVPLPPTRLEKPENILPDILAPEEIKQLYQVADNYIVPTYPTARKANYFEALALRDKAILSIFYGCGLRRNEGYHLNLEDINFDTQLLHVKKGKNYKERVVPISKYHSTHLQNYVFEGRIELTKDNTASAFFISERGKRLTAQSIAMRLAKLQHNTQDTVLQQKKVSLHTLRHSIATHLLDKGMSVENIARFLGHSSLESTQIYTHLINEE